MIKELEEALYEAEVNLVHHQGYDILVLECNNDNPEAILTAAKAMLALLKDIEAGKVAVIDGCDLAMLRLALDIEDKPLDGGELVDKAKRLKASIADAPDMMKGYFNE